MSSFAYVRKERHVGYPADVIPLQYHAHMLLDEHRTGAFERAISEVVEAGDHLLDLGTGTGVLAYFAARRGARVTAVERDAEVLAAARAALGDSVRLVHADAREFLPDEPVDVVVCEMLHAGLLRERQIEVIDGFKHRYLERFGGPLPRFVPEATVLAAQPVEQDFTYFGFHAPIPVFQDPSMRHPRTVELAAASVYQQFFYSERLPDRCRAELAFTASRAGAVNAVRLLTRNLLSVRLNPPGSVDWQMNHLVVPLGRAVPVEAGERVVVGFDYRPGDEISALTDSMMAGTEGGGRS